MTGNQAGQSADEVARRTREKIARLERTAVAWEAGAAGEQATGQVLAQLDQSQWRVVHDLRWPGRQRANIDHVVVGPPGVFVIDSKNWSGKVAVTDGVLRQNGRSREPAVAGVAEAGIAVLELVPDVPVHPVLCLVRDEPVAGWVRDVMLCSTANVLGMISTRPAQLSPDDVGRVTARIQEGTTRARRAPVRTSAGRSASRRTGPSLKRPLVAVTTMVLLIVGVQSGVYFAAFEKLGEVISENIVEDVGTDEPATKPDKPAKPKRQRQGRATAE